jgi:DNA primase
MSDRAQKSAERIREQIPIVEVLADYGYDVDIRGEMREQQFSCDLHGDGSDNKPSARLYPDNNQFFCFACGRSRDAIALVREKENITFWDAVRRLEKKFGLQALPWTAEDREAARTPAQVVKAAFERTETPEQALHRLERFLDSVTKERSLDPQRCAGLWEAYDRVVLFLAEDGVEPDQVVTMAHKVLTAAKEALKPPPEN